MELILYVKNKIKIIFIIIFYISISINIIRAEALIKEPKKLPTKYNTLKVQIIGLEPSLIKLLEKNLLILHASQETKLTKNRIENLHDKTEEEIVNNLQTLGYYNAKIVAATLQEISKYNWIASYTINLGPPAKIKDINLVLLGEINNSKLLTNINNLSTKYLHVNQQFTHENYEKTKQTMLNKLHDYGFLNARFNKSIATIDLASNEAKIEFIIDSKQQYYLGKVNFESNKYPEEFLKKYIPFKENDLYSTDSLMELKNNLLNSGLFSKVRIDLPTLMELPAPDAHNNNIPIIVRTIAKPANNYNGSIGFGTDTGPRASFGFARKRSSHHGHQFNMKIMGSKIRKKANFDYSFLGNNPVVDKYHFGLTAAEERIKKRYSKNAIFYLQKSKEYTNKQQIWKLNFLTEDFRLFPTDAKQHAKFLFPSLNLTWTTYNQQNNENNSELVFGNKLDINSKAASKVLGSANLLQITINNKLVQPLIYDISYILKGTLGFTAINNANKLPLSLRFFAGGDYSVRGFSYESLGPTVKDAEGNHQVIGAKNLITASLEIEKPVYNQISLAYFIDAGNAINKLNHLKNNIALASGIGVIYKTPIGSVRAYVAKPIKLVDNRNKKTLRFHLTFDAGL